MPTFRPHAGDVWRSVLRAAAVLCLLLFVGVLEVTALNLVEVGRVRPDVILIVLVYIAVEFGIGPAITVAVAGGVIQDVLGSGVMGSHVFSKVVVAIVLGYVGARVVIDRPAVKVSLMAGATVICMSVYINVLALSAFHYDARFYVTRLVIPSMFYNSIVMPPIWWAVWRYMRWIDEHVPRGEA